MSYDQSIVSRIRHYFADYTDVSERKMMGGLAFMVSGHMCVGANDHRLMARVGPKGYKKALEDMYVSIMDFTGKPLTGFVYVEPEAIENDQGLHKWLSQCEAFVRTLPPKQ